MCFCWQIVVPCSSPWILRDTMGNYLFNLWLLASFRGIWHIHLIHAHHGNSRLRLINFVGDDTLVNCVAGYNVYIHSSIRHQRPSYFEGSIAAELKELPMSCHMSFTNFKWKISTACILLEHDMVLVFLFSHIYGSPLGSWHFPIDGGVYWLWWYILLFVKVNTLNANRARATAPISIVNRCSWNRRNLINGLFSKYSYRCKCVCIDKIETNVKCVFRYAKLTILFISKIWSNLHEVNGYSMGPNSTMTISYIIFINVQKIWSLLMY